MSTERPTGELTPEAPHGDVLVGEQYYILASEVAADLPKLVLKHDEAFLVANRRGDLPNLPHAEFGFYVDGTRFLRRFELRLHGHRPLVLNAGVSEDAVQAAIDLTNPDVALGPQVLLPGRSLRIARRAPAHRERHPAAPAAADRGLQPGAARPLAHAARRRRLRRRVRGARPSA
jgi:hypothetical protein